MRRAAALALAPLALLGLGLVDPPYGTPPRRPRAGAALVLSGDVDYRRVQAAAALYRAGAVPALLLTGAGVGGDSASEMGKEALKAGVPPAALVLEERSTTTRENVTLAAPLVRERGLRRVALVTSASHMGRALRSARRAMPGVVFLPVPVDDTGTARQLYAARLGEWAKLAYYAARGWI